MAGNARPKGKPQKNPAPARPGNRWTIPAICATLAALVFIVFGQTLRHDFVNFDDDIYVTSNLIVQRGLTVTGMRWAFTHVVAGNWHPLTLLSHILDCQFYGLQPGGHHFTSVAMHAVTAVLLFLVLRSLTNAPWRAAFVAAIFAIHPLRAESVAWISERKDVLSGLFFMLTLAAYVRYARKPWSLARYLPVPILFTLGLMCKPMLVSLPLVLLLLDYWPLKRNAERGVRSAESKRDSTDNQLNWKFLLLEKIPLVLLSLAMCIVTLEVQDKARQAAHNISLSMRLGNAVVSAVTYTFQLFWPANLAAYYPFPPNGWLPWQISLSLVFLTAVSIAAFLWRRTRPYLFVGWLWYLAMLVPVIGIVQVGAQAHADRYTYLPLIGLCIALTWIIIELSVAWPYRARSIGAGVAIILYVLIVAAQKQAAYWHDSKSLWTRAIACTSSNAVAEGNLANYYLQQGRLDDAITHAQAALQIKPDDAIAHNCLGYALFQQQRYDDAIPHFQDALKIQPGFAGAHNNFGLALMQSGHPEDAIVEYKAALASEPDSVEAHNNLGVALLCTNCQPETAVAEYQKALDLNPDFLGAENNLAWLLATCPLATVRDGASAVQWAERASQLSRGNNLIVLRTLAAAYAEAGRFPEAIQTCNQARQLAADQGHSAWMRTLDSDLALYQSHQPLHDPGKK